MIECCKDQSSANLFDMLHGLMLLWIYAYAQLDQIESCCSLAYMGGV